jgi:polyphosphate kinase 2 (PPK2 family)
MNLSNVDPGTTGTFENKGDANEKLGAALERLAALQDMLYAQGSHALLIIFQGIDAAGKDGVIKHVMSGMNPQGIDVQSF